jgi:hypothetical protein
VEGGWRVAKDAAFCGKQRRAKCEAERAAIAMDAGAKGAPDAPDAASRESALSNIKYVFHLLWEFQKSGLAYVALVAVFNSAVPVFGIVFPKLIIDEMTGSGRMGHVLWLLAIGFGLVFAARRIRSSS